ncbi:PAS domain-containing protein [Chthonobacter rhizosphaerae]|uniref:PAS domain-containing protein n=1 Tax=Chthonobacter rhizosphaerae TaxID=2735553 RepID=UPI0015EF2596
MEQISIAEPTQPLTQSTQGGGTELAGIEDRLRRAQELGGAIPYEWDFRSNAIVATPALGRLYGLSEEQEITYEALVARIHPDDRGSSQAVHQQAIQSGGPYEQEYRVVHESGQLRTLLVRGDVIRDEHSRPIGLAGVAIDITSRKAVEIALREREAHLADRERFIRNVLASSDDCIKVLDLDANLQFMSEGGMRVMEVDDFGRIEGCSWPSFWIGRGEEKALSAVAAAKAGGVGRFEGFCPTLAGTPRWWDVAVTPIRDEDGRVERLLSISRDITARKQAEETLRLAQERIELAVAAGKVGTWVWDISAGTITADERLALMFGVDPADAARGAPVSMFTASVHPEDRERVETIMREVVQRGGFYEVEHRLMRADGTVRWIVARGECQFDETGQPIRFPGATVDITDLKQAQEAHELVTKELAHRIKNIFAVVNGILAMSARSEPTAKPFADRLRERLTALAQAHEYVRPHSPRSRNPAHANQTMMGLLRLLLAPYLQEGQERFEMKGADVLIGPTSATALALIFHEQATNSVKYGSLSTPTGRVAVSCENTGTHYCLKWQEVGGPAIDGLPERRGFGTELAIRSAASQLGGALSHEWAATGLIVHLTCPTERLRQ